MLQTANTVEGWSDAIQSLTQKQQASREHTERLLTQKQELALEAAMGSPDARKRLTAIHAELAKLTLEGDDWGTAIAQAETAKAKAERAEAETAERARQEELSTLARAAVRHAAEYTAALAQAVKAGAACKMTIQNMASRATPAEGRAWDQLVSSGPYMLGAEHSGLRAHLQFAPYNGPREHIVPLEATLAAYLDRWLQGKADDNGEHTA